MHVVPVGFEQRVKGRRRLFAFLTLVGAAGLFALAVAALSPGGIDVIDTLLLLLFAGTLPWTVVGFWNAAVGFAVMRFSVNPLSTIVPGAAGIRDDEPVTASTAITVFVRNEPPDRVAKNLDRMISELADAGCARSFHVYVLSDTSVPKIAAAEDLVFGELAGVWEGVLTITYRRRSENTAFKAGNFWDFCQRWGDRHDFALTLDTDSLMPAAAILRLVRIMQADAKLGILQALVVGLPSGSAFTRTFQFGMRLGMRSWTIGSAWWQSDCGPYWGHNAVVRLAAFKAHCHIAKLPAGSLLGEHILSHDQIEAALMRRAGYAVRVLPEEDLGWEENPPTLLEYMRRDQRWMQGNLQYGPFLVMPGLKPVSRFQLAFAMLMFLSSPAWIGLLVVGAAAAATSAKLSDFIDPSAGSMLLWLTLGMWFAPKIATVLDVMTRNSLRLAFGGGPRFLASVAIETLFFIMLSPIMWVSHTLFLAGLPFGRAVGWIGQVRDDHSVAWPVACRQFWPHAVLGWSVILALLATHPAAIPAALLVAGGPALAIPLAVLSSAPGVGRIMVRWGLGRLPEETTPPESLRALALPPLAGQST